MSSIKNAIKRARKVVKAKESELNDNSNKCIITDSFDLDPNGALVIILYPTDKNSHENSCENAHSI